MTEDDFLSLWDSLSQDGQAKLRGELEQALGDMAGDGSREALAQVFSILPADENATDAMLSQANEQAVAWAGDRAAELVGMTWDEDAGGWVPNPKPGWSIDETTRQEIQDLTVQALDNGWSNDELADAIQDSGAFSDARAEMIARTETAFADVQGSLEGWKASGLVSGKEWTVGDGCCDECQALDGKVVALDEAFPDDGGDGPPLHPNCRCDILPVVAGDEEA